ncbi:MAG: hypothetical protein DWB42_21485, partial [Chloroflexi bacterium]|nr:hypothetical protein [Chloroflexota bacterium]
LTVFFAPSPTPGPTLPATPTFVTAEAALTDTPAAAPSPAEASPQAGPPTFTATPQPTVALRVTLAPTLPAPPVVPTFIPANPQTRAFALSAGGGAAGFNLPHNDPALFARNPVDPNLYASTDTAGNLYLTGTINYRPDTSPFSQFIAQSRDENNAYVSAINWSPDGRYLAFITAGRKLADDGVWYFEPGQFPPLHLLVDCPTPGFPGCLIVSNPTDPDLWESRAAYWSPGSDALLVSLFLPGENRMALIVLPITRDERARDWRPPVVRYQYGAWSRDGGRILVSGAAPDGRVYVGWLNRDGSFAEMVYNAEANGLWMGFASPAADGRIYALGAPGDRNGPREPLRIYDQAGRALTPSIGTGFPERVEWSPDGRAVFVQTGGQQYIADINGGLRNITGQVAGARAINWVAGDLPPSEETPPSSGIPSGVVAGSAYQPGQQLRIYALELNIRTGPGTTFGIARAALRSGEYIAILAGPVTTPDNLVWWQVQTADGVVGWIAGQINGESTLGP